ncbi:MAG: multifunctional CCA addition/repair protein [Pseudomonadota bacterium]
MNTGLDNVYLVGGAVRDELLGLPVHERDYVVVGMTPDAMQSAGFKQVGKDFPVFLHPETGEEYALARTERKTGAGYTGFEVHADPAVTLEQDLERRDLTVNALAQRPDGSIVDPFGGLDDLKARLLRHVSPAFVEDPVRVLRAARFAARFAPLGFRIADDTMALMREMVTNGEIDALVPERVAAEMTKALREKRPSRFFETLREAGALARVFPEVDQLFGVPQPPQYHPEIDTGVHTMMVLDHAATLTDDVPTRFAALTHDLGKGTTPRDIWPGHRGHEERGVPLVEALCARLRLPNDWRDLARLVARHHTTVHRSRELRGSTALKLLVAFDAFRRPERFEKALDACLADVRGRLTFENEPYPQADMQRAWLAAARAVRPADLDLEGLKGEAIAHRIHDARVSAIKQAMRDTL